MPWLAIANSFCVDYLIRKKVALSLSYTVLDSMPFPRLLIDHPIAARLGRLALLLTCTAPEMTSYWNNMSAYGWCERVPNNATPPGIIDQDARAIARAEIDAIVAHDVFGISVDELVSILDTFPVLRRREERTYGEYRTKRLVLQAYNQLTGPIADLEINSQIRVRVQAHEDE
jgi:hypothetical protein